jgi:hypothetical protein
MRSFDQASQSIGINKSSYFEPLRYGVTSVVTLSKWDISSVQTQYNSEANWRGKDEM